MPVDKERIRSLAERMLRAGKDSAYARHFVEGGATEQNKWDRISNARYKMANSALLRGGAEKVDADRLARFLAAQSALEAGWVDDVRGHNYAGYMSNGKRMTFDNADSFWDYHLKNMDEKWPGWRQADSIDAYYNIINHPELGLDTKEKYDAYNRKHRNAPVYLYAPAWENENYLGKLRGVYNKYINRYVTPMACGGKMHKYDGESEDTGQMRRIPLWQRMLQIGTMAEAPAVMTAAGMEVNPDLTVTYGNDNEGVRQLRDNLRDIGIMGATSLLGSVPGIGKSVATGIDLMGRAAMPSTLLKGVASYVPKAANAIKVASPYLDAGALSLWSAEAGKAAVDAANQGDWGQASALGTMAALPFMPLAARGYQAARDFGNSFRLSPHELDLSALEPTLAQPEVTLPAAAKTTTKATQAAAPYVIEDLGGGYMLKSLMRGNPLEKQISKNGTVNVNNIKALINKGSKVEQAVVEKVLASEKFTGKKAIDYNEFRKAVQGELITYDRTPNTKWSDYGLDRIGLSFGNKTDVRNAEDRMNMLRERIATGRFSNGEKLTESDIADAKSQLKEMEAFWRQIPETETYTFSSSRIPNGSAKHYDANTLGHSRTYTTSDEPNVLHVMESQSDWGQGYKKMNLDGEYNQKRINSLERRINNLKESINSEMEGLRTEKMNDGSDMSPWFADSLRKQIEKDKQLLEELTVELDMRRNPKLAAQQDYLAENFTSRQIQENLRYAAEKGQTKMRYPTKETAAKIEGYPKETNYYDADGNLVTDSRKIYTIGKENEKELDLIQQELDGYYAKFNVAQLPNGDYVPAGDYSDNPYQQLIEAIPRKQAAYDGWRANHPNATSEKGQRVVDDMKRRAEEIKNFRARVKYLNQRMKELKSIKPYVDPSIKKEVRYIHEDDILRKYNEFPKQFKKLYKNADVRIVTDPKGNTWYEVDVPKDYLEQEWQYKKSGMTDWIKNHPEMRDRIKKWIESRRMIGTKYKEKVSYDAGRAQRNSDDAVIKYYRDIVDPMVTENGGDGFSFEGDFLDTRRFVDEKNIPRYIDGRTYKSTGIAEYPKEASGTTKVHEHRHQRDPEVFDVEEHRNNMAVRALRGEDISDLEYSTQFINQIQQTPEQASILEKAYPSIKDPTERTAVNREVGYVLYDAYYRIHGKYPNLREYKEFVNSLGKWDIASMLDKNVGYVGVGDGIRTALSEKAANWIKKAVLEVPMIGVPVAAGTTLLRNPDESTEL